MVRKAFLAAVSALVSPILLPQANTVGAQSKLGYSWTEVPGNPYVTGGGCLSWRCAGMSDPALLLASDGTLMTWFTTVGIRLESGQYMADGPYFGAGSGILSKGISIYPEAPVLSVGADGTWDKYLETPTVRHNADSTLTMWYVGHPTTDITNTALGQMVSTDAAGTNWIRPSVPIYKPPPGAWDAGLVSGPTVVKTPGGKWYLYYSGGGATGKQGVGLLTSSDGVNWKPNGNGPVFSAQTGAWDEQILEQSVIYFKGQYWMWYSAYRGALLSDTPLSIGVATSSDGIHWTRYAGNPVIKPGAPGTWTDLRIVAPDVVAMPDGSLLMIAYGQSITDVTQGSLGFWKSVP